MAWIMLQLKLFKFVSFPNGKCFPTHFNWTSIRNGQSVQVCTHFIKHAYFLHGKKILTFCHCNNYLLWRTTFYKYFFTKMWHNIACVKRSSVVFSVTANVGQGMFNSYLALLNEKIAATFKDCNPHRNIIDYDW